jgi:hypothetical protein
MPSRETKRVTKVFGEITTVNQQPNAFELPDGEYTSIEGVFPLEAGMVTRLWGKGFLNKFTVPIYGIHQFWTPYGYGFGTYQFEDSVGIGDWTVPNPKIVIPEIPGNLPISKSGVTLPYSFQRVRECSQISVYYTNMTQRQFSSLLETGETGAFSEVPSRPEIGKRYLGQVGGFTIEELFNWLDHAPYPDAVLYWIDPRPRDDPETPRFSFKIWNVSRMAEFFPELEFTKVPSESYYNFWITIPKACPPGDGSDGTTNGGPGGGGAGGRNWRNCPTFHFATNFLGATRGGSSSYSTFSCISNVSPPRAPLGPIPTISTYNPAGFFLGGAVAELSSQQLVDGGSCPGPQLKQIANGSVTNFISIMNFSSLGAGGDIPNDVSIEVTVTQNYGPPTGTQYTTYVSLPILFGPGGNAGSFELNALDYLTMGEERNGPDNGKLSAGSVSFGFVRATYRRFVRECP